MARDLNSVVDAMTDPYRLRGTTTRIIIEEKDGHWTAWFEHQPEFAFGGSTATEAISADGAR